MTEEELIIHDFITSLNYPRYSKVANILADDVESRCVYNGYYHRLIYTLWYNLSNDNVVSDIGAKIQKRGGDYAVRICFYILMTVLRYATQNNDNGYIIFHSIKDHISNRWAYLGDWKNINSFQKQF